MANFDKTDIFKTDEYKQEYVKMVLTDVINVIKEKNYDPINQIMGYIKTNNPIYIPRDNGAREKISKINTNEILEYLLYFFIKEI
ncbi:IreB family regulatory phosphoprotein [Gemelliphila asaccharolytica]|uniref:IreB family regulatory phosphoprotein n=1 Tax=Gemelliphila asaccharolytica TaxID=502393 RepID=A0ABR5TNH0_9BACL|nr:IreB family regulatory phosphoprotein [Gemella asaccharolytica]KXB58940.1 hypothetical protein HMPREF1871_00006 [Gemella asaccharolytica]